MTTIMSIPKKRLDEINKDLNKNVELINGAPANFNVVEFIHSNHCLPLTAFMYITVGGCCKLLHEYWVGMKHVCESKSS